jgi:hypothetical protein
MPPSAAAILRMLEALVVAATCSSVKAVRALKVVTLLHVAAQLRSVVVLDLAMSLLEADEVKLKLHNATSTYPSALATGGAQGRMSMDTTFGQLLEEPDRVLPTHQFRDLCQMVTLRINATFQSRDSRANDAADGPGPSATDENGATGKVSNHFLCFDIHKGIASNRLRLRISFLSQGVLYQSHD